jgi:2-polyprenyl-6-methoxyphenol hydroxylase-like FAD-dependent oxidoreductase
VGGLFAALLLRRIGWQVDVFERSSTELSSRGAGIVTHDELFTVLRLAGIALDPLSLGVSVPGRRVFATNGDILRQLALPQVLTTWGRLYVVLREALPDRAYHVGMDLRSIEETPSSVIAHFANGTQEQADLLIGADGLNSTVRRQFLPETVQVYAGYVAWRGLVEEADLSLETRTSLCDWFAFSLPPGEQMLGYPVAGADGALMPGRRRFNFVWYRPANAGEPLAALLTDKGDIRHELSIPPDRIRPQVIAQMRADSERLLAPQFAEIVRRTRQPFLQAIIDLDSPRMAPGRHGRVAIVGAAAFVARPHVGM